ncbi:hypothetical protein [Sinorhizobium meliloti]|uniref:hypothetical protein n=1 Tax=Rhizobium meliloti TaxID=382 RepID=UPI0002EF77D8|nr:hypothetical protein [Sinorhizobium meliloti]MDW9807181.1 hypothetical protein [Sinorhizobium meliloti]MDW9828655.1 hypothetical protein [Sinorhizobium meliloti]MDX0199133.1 hypothetical protein [Sinorhizobium meliloti]MDX0236476.1 hypothetical protein [Sinorhizobium meliloti]MDX0278241.1 hypothetical protein [Sinorhizobium meliloti]
MPNIPAQAAAEGLPNRDAAIAKAMLRLEAQINDLASMSQIMADLLNDVLHDDQTRDEHGYVRMRVSVDDMSNIAFAWHNVASRAGGLKNAFYAASNEGK